MHPVWRCNSYWKWGYANGPVVYHCHRPFNGPWLEVIDCVKKKWGQCWSGVRLQTFLEALHLQLKLWYSSFRQHGCFVMFQCLLVLLVSSLLKWIGRNGLTLKWLKQWQVQSPWSLHFLSTTVDCVIWTIFVCLTLSCPSNPRYLFD